MLCGYYLPNPTTAAESCGNGSQTMIEDWSCAGPTLQTSSTLTFEVTRLNQHVPLGRSITVDSSGCPVATIRSPLALCLHRSINTQMARFPCRYLPCPPVCMIHMTSIHASPVTDMPTRWQDLPRLPARQLENQCKTMLRFCPPPPSHSRTCRSHELKTPLTVLADGRCG